jgi:hypothetical protein
MCSPRHDVVDLDPEVAFTSLPGLTDLDNQEPAKVNLMEFLNFNHDGSFLQPSQSRPLQMGTQRKNELHDEFRARRREDGRVARSTPEGRARHNAVARKSRSTPSGVEGILKGQAASCKSQREPSGVEGASRGQAASRKSQRQPKRRVPRAHPARSRARGQGCR